MTKKWSGKCPSCNGWNSLKEYVERHDAFESEKGLMQTTHSLSDISAEIHRIPAGYVDVDRVLGGGLVVGSAVLIGGDPGVGKSTLIMQVVNNVSSEQCRTLYVSGEESIEQIRLRAQRLGVNNANVMLLACSNIQDIMATVLSTPSIKTLIIDSVQTMRSNGSDGAFGSMSQVKQCAQELTMFAKSSSVTTILIGHITKDGSVAGPKVLEHMVDAVLYFEGEKNYQFRILRSIKNRYGSTSEIGIFRMTEAGLEEVPDPSFLFTGEPEAQCSGSVIFASIEGNRPLLMEIQALVAPTYMAYPRRTIVGWDNNRLDMILAILHARYKLQVLDKEVYLNVVGGIKTQEPGADLAVAMAIISATQDFVFPKRYVAFGEIGLGGEVRAISSSNLRIKEALKVGLKHIVVPKNIEIPEVASANIIRVSHIAELKKIIE